MKAVTADYLVHYLKYVTGNGGGHYFCLSASPSKKRLMFSWSSIPRTIETSASNQYHGEKSATALTVIWTNNGDGAFLRANSVESICVPVPIMIAFVVNIELV